MTKIFISDIKADEDFVSSSKTIRIGTSGNVKIQTPMKPSLKGMNGTSAVREIYRKIKPSVIDLCLNNSAYDSEYGSTTGSMRDPNALNIFTLAYDSKNVIPTDNQIKQMSDIQYNNTDVVVLPSWFRLIKECDRSQVELYLELSDKFYNYSSFRNHKPVIAAIPSCIPNDKIEGVLKHFVEMDITTFILDFNGRSMINGTWLRNFTREWDSYKLEKEGFLYSINSYQGVDKKNVGNYEAKDFLGCLAGIDLVGDKHEVYGGSNEPSEMNHTKVFSAGTYCYQKVFCPTKEFEKYKVKSIDNQIRELTNVRDHLTHGERLLEVVETKSLDPKTVSSLRSFKSEKRVVKKHLDDFF